MAVTGVTGLEGILVKTQWGVVVYLAVPQSHQEVGDIHAAPSGVHVVGIWVGGVIVGIWEDSCDCPLGVMMGISAGVVRTIEVEAVFNLLDDISSAVLGPVVAAWSIPQPEATPPAPITGIQPTGSPVLGS